MNDELVPIPVEPAPIEPTPARRSRRRWLLPVAIGGGLVVALIATAGILWAVLSAQHSPAAQAERFLDALVEDEATDAIQLLDTLPEGTTLLSSEHYEASEGHIESFELGQTTNADGATTVAATVVQGEEDYSVELPVVAVGRTGPFDAFLDWRIDGDVLPLVELTLPRPADAVVVANGLPVTDVPNSARVFVRALPATYEFGLADPGPLLDVTPAAVVAPLGERVSTAGTVVFSEEGQAAARAAVDAFLAACTAQPSLTPDPACGMVPPTPTPGWTYSNVQWSLVTAPSYELEPWSLDGSVVRSTAHSAFRVDADYAAPGETGVAWWTWGDIELTGVVKFVDGSLTFVSAY